ncbi:Vesicle-associated protein 1-1 [Vitis vinifera]|uniref:Vesicle-associated protein 1-1 n=1 Tax=Vitis vinifera TaxID=29760 RepID=A0A438DNK7_VITVI|nr:Vesicle-associated protein 1-1 [Vitis vinifera]
MTPFEPALDNRPLRNGPSSVTSNYSTHLGVLTTTWYAVSIDANFMRWSGSKWRYLKVFVAHEKVSTGKLLSIEPLERKFPFELKRQISCSLQLPNKIENHVVFKVKTMNSKKYHVHLNTGIVLPQSTCDVIVTMRAQKEAPSNLHYKTSFSFRVQFSLLARAKRILL